MCGYLSNLFFVLAAETRDGLQEKGASIETSKYVTEPLRLKTRSIRACSVCPLTTRVRAGTSCSTNTLTPLCDWMISARQRARAACLRSTPPPKTTTITVMLFRIHRFVANDTCRTFVGAKLYHIRRVGDCRVRKHQSPGN